MQYVNTVRRFQRKTGIFAETRRFLPFERKELTDLERVRRDNNEIEINLADVFQILLSKWIYILIAGLVAAHPVATRKTIEWSV